MKEHLRLTGLRQRKTELPNQVYIASSGLDCMTQVFMPALARRASPKHAVAIVRREVQCMQSETSQKSNTILQPDTPESLSPLHAAIQDLPPHLREAIADDDPSTMGSLTEAYFRGDFISINYGLISTEKMMEAVKCHGRLPSAFYQLALRENVNDLGTHFHLEIGLKNGQVSEDGRFILPRDTDPGTYAYAKEIAEYAIVQFSSPARVEKLSRLPLAQYVADGVDIFRGQYESEPPTEAEHESVQQRNLEHLLNGDSPLGELLGARVEVGILGVYTSRDGRPVILIRNGHYQGPDEE